jgi:hypothetical protein
MHYLLVDSHGSALDTFADHDEAVHAWDELVHSDPSARDDVALLRCDDDGRTIDRIDAAREAATL